MAVASGGLGDAAVEAGAEREAHQTERAEGEEEAGAGAGPKVADAGAGKGPDLAAAATAAGMPPRALPPPAGAIAAPGQTVSPTEIALPALPPLLTSSMETAPPSAEAVATPALPALAVSVCCRRSSSTSSDSADQLFRLLLRRLLLLLLLLLLSVVVPLSRSRSLPASAARLPCPAGIADGGAAVGHDVEDGGVLDDAAADGDTASITAALRGVGAGGGDGAEAQGHDGRHGYRQESCVAHSAFSIHPRGAVWIAGDALSRAAPGALAASRRSPGGFPLCVRYACGGVGGSRWDYWGEAVGVGGGRDGGEESGGGGGTEDRCRWRGWRSGRGSFGSPAIAGRWLAVGAGNGRAAIVR